jgi:hypothetical protein
MEAVREVSFNSSVVTTLPTWRMFVERSPEPMSLFSDGELVRLTPAERLAYDDERGDYHAELPALNTPILNRTVTKGLLFMRLNRGQQMGTPCGLILSGVPGVGKTTAVKALGRTVEQRYRKRNPQMTGTPRSCTSPCQPPSTLRLCPLSCCTSSAPPTPPGQTRRRSPTRRAS